MNARLISPTLVSLGRPPARFADVAVAKYDGQRGLAVLDGGTVTLLSRNGADVSHTVPEITAALPGGRQAASCARRRDRRPRPGRRAVFQPAPAAVATEPPTQRRTAAASPYPLLCLRRLELNGKDLTRRPYADRRHALAAVAENADSRTVQFPCNWTDTDPHVVLAASAELGLEGIVCKHLQSRYTPGLRSRDWIKTPHRLRSEFVIGGWLPGMRPNNRTVGALLVGAYADGRLKLCGVVGVGLSDAERRRLTKVLKPLHCNASPIADVPLDIAPYARWVRAELAGDVEYREFSRTLRHPSWKGLRPDVDSGLVDLPRP